MDTTLNTDLESSQPDDAGSGIKRPTPLVFTVDEAAAALHLGRTSIYKLIGEGRLRALKFGRSTRLAVEDIKRLVEGSP